MKQSIRPSKNASRVQFFMTLPFIGFGIYFLILGLRTGFMFSVIFAIVWIGMVAYNGYRAYINGFTDKTLSLYEIESHQAPDEALRSLEKLHEDMLITDDEYKERRKKIMEKW